MNINNLIDELEEIIYIIDFETHEFLYINEAGKKALKIQDYKNKKCFEIIHDFDCPCMFCTNDKINENKFHTWEFTSKKLNKNFILRDKLIIWNGRKARMEVAIDITEKEIISKTIQDKLKNEKELVDFIKTITARGNFESSINITIKKVGQYYNADRCYIFEIFEEHNLVRNTYEWCNINVESQIGFLQNLTLEDISRWLHIFRDNKIVIINDVENIKECNSKEYNILHSQNINSLIAVPLIIDDKIMGFIGLDNPRDINKDFSLIDSLAFFIIEEMEKNKVENKLYFLSYHDAFTGFFNRNKYLRFLENIETNKLSSLGIVFLDIEDLKKINEIYGYNQGNSFILKTCEILKKYFSEYDIYRISGDEFVIVCKDIDYSLFIEKINLSKEEFENLDKFTVSIVQTWSDENININLLTDKADKLILQEKRKYYKKIKDNLLLYDNFDENGDILSDTLSVKKRIVRNHFIARWSYDAVYELNLTTEKFSLIHKTDNKLVCYPIKDNIKEVFNYIYRYIVHPDDLEILKNIFDINNLKAQFKNEDLGLDIGYRHLGSDNIYYWISASFKRIIYPKDIYEKDDIIILILLKNINDKIVKKSDLRKIENKHYTALKKTCDCVFDVNIENDTYLMSLNKEIYSFKQVPTSGKYDFYVKYIAKNFIYPDDRKKWLDNMLLKNMINIFNSGKKEISVDYRIKHNDKYLWFNNLAIYLTGDNLSSNSIMIILHNIESQKQSEQIGIKNELLNQEIKYQKEINFIDSRYKIIVEQTKASIIEWCKDVNKFPIVVKEGENRGSVFVSNELIEDFDYKKNNADSSFLWYLLNNNKVHKDDRDKFEEFIFRSYSGNYAELICRVTKDEKKFEWYKFTLSVILGKDGTKERMIGTVLNVDQETRAKEALKIKAERDALTGILNQSTFYVKADEFLKKYKNNSYVIIMMDIDKFKIVNDIYGMDGGNKALIYISNIIQENINKDDLCARMYADVFYIMANCKTDNNIISLVNRITRKLRNMNFGSMLIPSFGICRVTNKDIPIVKLCEMAGFAHKSIKGNYIKHWMFYDETIKQNVVEEKQIENEMENALEQDEFLIYLQPKYNMAKKEIVGAEALVRWKHPIKGLIPPNKFIPLFEKNGFIIKLDVFVWEQVCKILRKWIDEGKKVFPISVNVSRLHLYNPLFRITIEKLVKKYNLPHSLIELELTENLFFDNIEHLFTVLTDLQKEGFTLDMDDFGSGYSSLNILKNLPVDVLKIDCEFFNETVATEKGKTVIKYTVGMANEMNMKVVAEGVETEEQVKFLLDVGCQIAQGYYFSKPIPISEFEAKYL